MKLLENHYDKIDEIEITPNYNTQTQQINITVRSHDTRFITKAGSQVSTLLQQEFPAPLGHAIANSLCRIELEINQPQQILEQLDQPIAQVRDSNSIDPQRLEPLPSTNNSTGCDRQFHSCHPHCHYRRPSQTLQG